MKYDLEILDLLHRIEVMKDYMHIKILEDDFHGVADAANDIREMKSKLWVYQKLDEGTAHGCTVKESTGVRESTK